MLAHIFLNFIATYDNFSGDIVVVTGAIPKGSITLIPTTLVSGPIDFSNISGFAIKTSSRLYPCSNALSTLLNPTWATFDSPVIGSVSTGGQKTLSKTHSGSTSYGPHAINPYKKFPL